MTKLGRPSSYTDEIAQAICDALTTAEGGLEEVCAKGGMPHASTVYRWLNDPERDDFRELYTRARETLGDYMAHKGVSEALTATDAQIGRLRFDARRWAAGKLNGRRWGDKVTNEVVGPDGGPVKAALTVEFVRAGNQG